MEDGGWKMAGSRGRIRHLRGYASGAAWRGGMGPGPAPWVEIRGTG